MKVLVDTCVWSLALRRRPGDLHAEEQEVARELTELVREGRACLIGPIRQEILSGVRDETAFTRLAQRLRPFEDMAPVAEDFELAARFYNECRAQGIPGTTTDMLICAVAMQHDLAIFTIDGDFTRYASVLPICLHGFEA